MTRSEEGFFDAWKSAVKIAGVRFFGDGTQAGFDHAKTKWDLCPRYEIDKQSFRGMSPGTAIFLGSMYAFYNDVDSRKMLNEVNLTTDISDITRMDYQRMNAIAALIITYPGW